MIDSEHSHFIIGNENSDFVRVEVLSYERPNETDYWDANWINSRIRIKVRSFSADYLAKLQTIDFGQFKTGIEGIYKNLNGAAQFYSLENWLTIILTGDGIGHFKVECNACDFPASGSKLKFELLIDQTELPKLINQLKEILEKFPIKANPEIQQK